MATQTTLKGFEIPPDSDILQLTPKAMKYIIDFVNLSLNFYDIKDLQNVYKSTLEMLWTVAGKNEAKMRVVNRYIVPLAQAYIYYIEALLPKD